MMRTSEEPYFKDKLEHMMGVTLAGFTPRCNLAYTRMDSSSIESVVRVYSHDYELRESNQELDANGNFLGFHSMDYKINNHDIAAAMSARSKLYTAYRLLFGYSLPPKSSQKDIIGFEADTTIDFPRLYPNQFSTFTNHIPLFTNLKELYLDQTIRASSIRKHKKKQSTAYIWQKLAAAVSKLPQLEVISLRENEISQYSDEDFDGLLELLATAKTVIYVDLSRNTLHSLKAKRFENLAVALAKMTSLMSCNLTEYEPIKKYAKFPRDFASIYALLTLRQKLFREAGYPSEYVRDLRQQQPGPFRITERSANQQADGKKEDLPFTESLIPLYQRIWTFVLENHPACLGNGVVRLNLAFLLDDILKAVSPNALRPVVSYRLFSALIMLLPSLIALPNVKEYLIKLLSHLFAELIQVDKLLKADESSKDIRATSLHFIQISTILAADLPHAKVCLEGMLSRMPESHSLHGAFTDELKYVTVELNCSVISANLHQIGVTKKDLSRTAILSDSNLKTLIQRIRTIMQAEVDAYTQLGSRRNPKLKPRGRSPYIDYPIDETKLPPLHRVNESISAIYPAYRYTDSEKLAVANQLREETIQSVIDRFSNPSVLAIANQSRVEVGPDGVKRFSESHRLARIEYAIERSETYVEKFLNQPKPEKIIQIIQQSRQRAHQEGTLSADFTAPPRVITRRNPNPFNLSDDGTPERWFHSKPLASNPTNAPYNSVLFSSPTTPKRQHPIRNKPLPTPPEDTNDHSDPTNRQLLPPSAGFAPFDPTKPKQPPAQPSPISSRRQLPPPPKMKQGPGLVKAGFKPFNPTKAKHASPQSSPQSGRRPMPPPPKAKMGPGQAIAKQRNQGGLHKGTRVKQVPNAPRRSSHAQKQ